MAFNVPACVNDFPQVSQVYGLTPACVCVRACVRACVCVCECVSVFFHALGGNGTLRKSVHRYH